MNAKEYLNRLLVRYAGTFDIYVPYIDSLFFNVYGMLYIGNIFLISFLYSSFKLVR